MRTGGHRLERSCAPTRTIREHLVALNGRRGLHESPRSHARDDLQKRLRPVAGIPDSLAE
jgi:hypothetical protein